MKDPQRWNVSDVGPLDRCLRCFTPLSDERSFCLECGHSGTVFTASGPMSGQLCFKHRDVAATTYCSLCAQPICDACIEGTSHSYFTGVTVTRCRDCVAQMERVEKQFFKKLLDFSHYREAP